jgi:hypothetical protein
MQLPPIPGLPSGLSNGLSNLAGLAGVLRARLAEVGDALGPLLGWRADPPNALPAGSERLAAERAVIVSAAEPFAPSSYARARLLRQMHACGLLSDQETEQAEALLGVAT